LHKIQGSEISRQILDSGKRNDKHAKNVKSYIRSCFIIVVFTKRLSQHNYYATHTVYLSFMCNIEFVLKMR